MNVLITGGNGFIAKNLVIKLSEEKALDCSVSLITRENSTEELAEEISKTDFIFHLAGTNRPDKEVDFVAGNVDLTKFVIDSIAKTGRKIPVVYSSSIQAEESNPYGSSKRAAENLLLEFSKKSGSPVFIYRLPNVFGKWSRPNYNSVVATFCHNVINDISVHVHDKNAMVKLVYVDDVVGDFVDLISTDEVETGFRSVGPVREISVGDLKELITSFRESRETMVSEMVGSGLTRALYSTYVSFLPPQKFSYPLVRHEDERGVFVEFLKTKDSGQFSFFSAHPGITRGGHYHHTKTEKFLVIKGRALYRFRNILTDEYYEIESCESDPLVIESAPGWAHDVTNIGDTELLVMLWANEIFDPERPDTYAHEI